MNKTYRLIWSDRLNTFVVAAENVKARGKRASGVVGGTIGQHIGFGDEGTALIRLPRACRMVAIGAVHKLTTSYRPTLLALTLAIAGIGVAHADTPAPAQLPTGGQVAAGAASIAQSGARMDVTQTTNRAVINWNTFNVGAQAHVNYNQPSASSATLNRVLDTNPSQILGKITANGQVFFVNPNGVYFGKGSSVDVGALVASTKNIKDADFMAGNMKFTRDGSTGSVVNEGEIRAALDGFVALLAPEVRNEGVIIAQLGTVALASGEAVSLQFDGEGRLHNVTVEPSQIKALVENKGAVLAPGGLIILSARAVDRLQGGVVKNSGTLEATGMSLRGGKIVLDASDRIENTGIVSANAGNDGSPAGSITLTAPEIVNSGSISANGGVSGLAATVPVDGGNIVVDATTFVQTAGASLDASGSQGGIITVQAAQDITLEGSVNAAANENTGGNISIVAQRNVTLNSAVLDVSGPAGGGRVHVQAGGRVPTDPPLPEHQRPTLALTGSTTLRSSSARGRGGNITLGGEQIGLWDNTLIDASGETGGGTVLIGGDWQGGLLPSPLAGEGPGERGSIATAQAVVMSENARIDVSAVKVGAGGTAVLWSEAYTGFYGSIAAKGGAEGGDGGQVETSSHDNLQAFGNVDASATADKGGKVGNWLLDPGSVIIASSGASGSNYTLVGITYTPNQPSTILASSIVSSLASSNVEISTGGGASNDITVNTAISWTSARNLQLTAGRNIILNANIIHSNGTNSANLTLVATAGGVSGTGAITFGSAASNTVGITQGGTSTYSGVISGTLSSFSKDGVGTLTLGGTNTYTGNTRISQGALAISSDSNLGAAPGSFTADSITLAANSQARLIANASFTLNANRGIQITGNGSSYVTLDVASGATLTYNSVIKDFISANGFLNKSGLGTLSLGGANTYAGTTNVSAGTLKNVGNNVVSANLVTVSAGATWDLNSYSDSIWALTGAGNVALGGGTMSITEGSGYNFSGVISGTGNVTKYSGAGTQVFSGLNTYTGITTVSAGALSVNTIGNGGVASALGAASTAAANLVLSNGTLIYTGATSSTDRAFTLSAGTAGTFDISTAGTTLTFSGASAATTGALTKIGTGTLELTGANLYTGSTTLNAGTLSVSSLGNGGTASGIGAATNAASKLVLGGGTLMYTGASASTDRNFTLTAATTNTFNIFDAAATLTWSGASTATTGALTKAGAGTLTLSGTNLYTGATTIAAGTLVSGASGVIADSSAVSLSTSGASWNLAGYNETVGSLTGVAGTTLELGSAVLTAGGLNTSRCDRRQRRIDQNRQRHADTLGCQYLHRHHHGERRHAKTG